MNRLQEAILNQIVRDWDTAYKNFLKTENLEDNDMVRAGYYATVKMLMDLQPMPDKEIQDSLVAIIQGRSFEILINNFNQIRDGISAIAKERKEKKGLSVEIDPE